METVAGVLGFSPQFAPRLSEVTYAHGDALAKTASKKKPPPEPNAEAIRAMAREARARMERIPPSKFAGKRSRAMEEAFLDGLRGAWSVTKSAWSAGLDTSTVYEWRTASMNSKREDGTFADDFYPRWLRADQDGVDRLEDEATRRSVEGVEKPVYQTGVMVGTVTEYSDTLLMLKMRGKRPETYNTERHELTGKDGGPIATKMEIEFIESEVER